MNCMWFQLVSMFAKLTTSQYESVPRVTCWVAAQRKGILDLYGEQALKAGQAETEPGKDWAWRSFTHMALETCEHA